MLFRSSQLIPVSAIPLSPKRHRIPPLVAPARLPVSPSSYHRALHADRHLLPLVSHFSCAPILRFLPQVCSYRRCCNQTARTGCHRAATPSTTATKAQRAAWNASSSVFAPLPPPENPITFYGLSPLGSYPPNLSPTLLPKMYHTRPTDPPSHSSTLSRSAFAAQTPSAAASSRPVRSTPASASSTSAS